MNLFQRLLKLLGVEMRFVGETRLEGNSPTVAAPAPAAPDVETPVAAKTPEAPRPPSTTISIPAQAAPFVSPDLLRRLPLLTPREADALDFGCVRVSDQGLVQLYNRWESEFAGVPQETALGRNFFRELAPCTNNRLIFGRFKDGIEEDELNTIVSYAFTYKMRPTLVKVHLYRDPATKTNWVLVQKHEARPGK